MQFLIKKLRNHRIYKHRCAIGYCNGAAILAAPLHSIKKHSSLIIELQTKSINPLI